MNTFKSYFLNKIININTKINPDMRDQATRVLGAGVLAVSLFLFSCGLTGDGCSEECSGPGSFFISCPDTREGCKEKKIRLGCGSFSFNENKRACKVFDCSGNCFLSGLFKVAEYETDYSYVEIFEDPETDTELTVEWFNYE